MKRLPPKELTELLDKFTTSELMYLYTSHRYSAYDEFPELVDYLQYCAAKKEGNNAEINRLFPISVKQRGLID